MTKGEIPAHCLKKACNQILFYFVILFVKLKAWTERIHFFSVLFVQKDVQHRNGISCIC